MAWTHFGDVDLSLTKELFTVQHFGPSSIGIDTIMRSDGKIPESFLRETGVSDNIIQNIALLTEKGLSHQNCFLSYGAKDDEFAEKLYTDLQNKGVRCWYASEDMKIGDKTWDSIYHYIRMRDTVLLILSEDSISSDWIEGEVNAALAEENKRKRPIFFPSALMQQFWTATRPGRNILIKPAMYVISVVGRITMPIIWPSINCWMT